MSGNVVLPPLACPGGPQLKSEGIKYLFKVPHAGYLAKYDQRFVLNLKLTHQIASYLSRTTLKSTDKVILELGPGPGTLTRSLLTRDCVGVLGIELDMRFNPHLQQIESYTKGKFRWANADILKSCELELLASAFPDFVKKNKRRAPLVDDAPHRNAEEDEEDDNGDSPLRTGARERILRQRSRRHRSSSNVEAERSNESPAFGVSSRWWSDGEAKVEVVANLPFRIMSELLVRYAVDCSQHTGLFAFGRVPLHIFVQREIAERIIAPAGSLYFSRLSVMCQVFFHIHVKQTFSEWTYFPVTEVQGALVTLEPRSVAVENVDGSVLVHFVNKLMPHGKRGSGVYSALSRFVPEEVVQYMLQEIRVDGGTAVLDLPVAVVAKLAMLWKEFVVHAGQQSPSA